MLNFQNPTIKNNDCYCCGTIRRHPKPNWHGCLNFKKPSCPKMNTPSHNVLAPSNAQHSKVMRDVQQLKVAAPGRGRWKKVNWRRFKLQQQTKEYQTRVITNSTNNNSNLVIRNGTVITKDPIQNQNNLEIKPNCPNALNLTWNEISQMTKQQIDSYYGGAPVGCKYYKFPNDSSSSTTIDTPMGQQCTRIQQWQTR